MDVIKSDWNSVSNNNMWNDENVELTRLHECQFLWVSKSFYRKNILSKSWKVKIKYSHAYRASKTCRNFLSELYFFLHPVCDCVVLVTPLNFARNFVPHIHTMRQYLPHFNNSALNTTGTRKEWSWLKWTADSIPVNFAMFYKTTYECY
jgi:hypothetical protein